MLSQSTSQGFEYQVVYLQVVPGLPGVQEIHFHQGPRGPQDCPGRETNDQGWNNKLHVKSTYAHFMHGYELELNRNICIEREREERDYSSTYNGPCSTLLSLWSILPRQALRTEQTGSTHKLLHFIQLVVVWTLNITSHYQNTNEFCRDPSLKPNSLESSRTTLMIMVG